MNIRWIAGLPALAGTAAWAHEGHGLAAASHWHATDAWGLVALAVAGGLWLWWRGRR